MTFIFYILAFVFLVIVAYGIGEMVGYGRGVKDTEKRWLEAAARHDVWREGLKGPR